MSTRSQPDHPLARTVVACLLSLLPAGDGARAERAVPTSGLPGCETLLTSDPAGQEAALCVYEAARAGKPAEVASTAGRLLETWGRDSASRPWFTLYLGNLHYADTEHALDLYGRALDGFLGSGESKGEMFTRMNRSRLLHRAGELAQAERETDRVIEIGTSSADPELRAWGAIELARRIIDRGEDLSRARDLLVEVRIPSGVVGEETLHQNRLLYLGNVCATIGLFDEALDAYRRLAETAVATEKPFLEATARTNLAWLGYERLQEAPSPSLQTETRSQAERALALATRTRQSTGEAHAAWILAALTPGEAGLAYLRRCRAAAESPALESYCLNPLAARIAATDGEAARTLIERSLDLAKSSADPQVEARVWQRAMEVEWSVSPPLEALAASRRALVAIESLRESQTSGSLTQAGFFSRWSDQYGWLAGRVLEAAGRGLDRGEALATAFELQERSRSRALADWLARSDAGFGEGTETQFVKLTAIREELEDGEALLSFQIAPWQDSIGEFGGGSWVLVATRAAVTVHRLPDRFEVRHRLRLFDAAIARRASRRDLVSRGAMALYRDLLAEALDGMSPEVHRLILVPDDALHRLPFAALQESEDAQPLGATYEMVQVPSATLWLRWRRAERPPAERPLLVLADPDLPEAAAGVGRAIQTAQGPRPASFRDAGATLGRLPHARREGRDALRALGGGRLLIGAEATEAALHQLPLAAFLVLHFGAHAVTDENRPERSAVLLAATAEEPGADGYLQSGEIARLDLHGRVVVLAACRSASGATLRGEGVMSLARAFFQAGAHTVVASLWPLRDDESAAMFDRFYRHLGRGASVAGALHEARREAIDAGEPAASWAGLVVLGDGSVVPLPGGRRGPEGATFAALLGVSFLVAAIGGWALRRRRLGRRA